MKTQKMNPVSSPTLTGPKNSENESEVLILAKANPALTQFGHAPIQNMRSRRGDETLTLLCTPRSLPIPLRRASELKYFSQTEKSSLANQRFNSFHPLKKLKY